MLTYSIAIRTLGTAGDKFRQELDSICFQTIQPERVVVYIAEGYERPDYTVGKEEYVWIPKGMVAQRALLYHEIKSDCILLLDDDVWLAPNSAEKMLRAMEIHHADCIGADVFQNHSMPLMTKIYAAITNLVFPHFGQKWAFKIHRNGSFSYLNNPKQSFYWSQKSDGPACLWKKSTFLKLRMEDECWLDHFRFAYNDDTLESYKLYRNDGRLGILFDSGIKNLDGQTASASFRNSPNHIYIRTKASLMIWWRSCYKNGKNTLWSRLFAATAFGFKTLWLIPVMCAAAFVKLDWRYMSSYFKGLLDGWKDIHSPAFRNLPPYITTPHRLKTLQIITSLRTGGAEKIVVDLLPRLQRAGERDTLLLFDGTKTPLYEDLEHKGVPIASISMGWRAMRNPFLVFKLIRFLRRGKYDIVHTHNTSCQLMAAVASLFVPLSLITTEHNTTNKRRSWRAFKPIDRWMYGRYRRIICVGEDTKSALQDYLPEVSGKTVVIANGIDLDRFRQAVPDHDIAATMGFKVLMVAAFRAQKDHACLVRAINLLPETYHLFLAGGAETPEDEKTLQSCKNLARSLNLENRVRFLGVREDIPELLAASDIAVLSSHHEGLSLSAVECMAGGKALIASDVNGLKDLVSGAGLLFPPGNSEKLAGLIRQVCENPALAHEIGARCQARAVQYDIAETARRYREEYNRILACPN